MIEINYEIEEQLVSAEAHDNQVDPEISDKVVSAVFDSKNGSEKAICIHQSRSITC